MEATDVIRALADPQRLKVLAAVALGATSRDQVGAAVGIDGRAVATATVRLEAAGLLDSGAGELRVNHAGLRELVRNLNTPADDEEADGVDTDLAQFVRGERLRHLPSKRNRRHAVLAHIVESSFDEGKTYDERAVNVVLEKWCEDSEVDHVAIRRYLIDHQLLHRVRGVYGRSLDVLPVPGEAERYMTAIGLD